MLKQTLLGAALAITLLGAGCGTTPTAITPDSATTTNYITQTDNILGFSFTYPLAFTATTGEAEDAANTTILKTGYFVSENPSGVPGNEYNFPFEVRVSYASSSKALNLSNELKKGAPTWKTDYDNYKAGKGAGDMKVVTVGGKESYRFQAGAEGMNSVVVFVPKNDREMITIFLLYIGDTLKTSIQPKPISEAEQLKIFDDILKSFTFTK